MALPSPHHTQPSSPSKKKSILCQNYDTSLSLPEPIKSLMKDFLDPNQNLVVPYVPPLLALPAPLSMSEKEHKSQKNPEINDPHHDYVVISDDQDEPIPVDPTIEPELYDAYQYARERDQKYQARKKYEEAHQKNRVVLPRSCMVERPDLESFLHPQIRREKRSKQKPPRSRSQHLRKEESSNLSSKSLRLEGTFPSNSH